MSADSTAASRQRRRLARLAYQGVAPTQVLVHQECRFVLQELKPYLVDPQYVLPLREVIERLQRDHRPVNVSEVKQISPFRYPGGKTWLVPEVKAWLKGLPRRPRRLIEPFAGGAIIGLTAAAEHLVDQVILAELDEAVAAVWQIIIHGSEADVRWLCKRIIEFEVTEENVRDVLSQEHINLRQKAFQTILKNRINRGGILAKGASKMKNGENGKGLASRWYPATIARRIEMIRVFREKLSFLQADAVEVIKRYRGNVTTAWFLDPPYTAGGKSAGARLYNHNRVDHPELFRLMKIAAGPVMMTYDDSEEVRLLAERCGFKINTVPMKNTHHAVMNELLITKV